MSNSSMGVPNPKARRKTNKTFRFWTVKFKIRIQKQEQKIISDDLEMIANLSTIVPIHFGVLNTLFRLRPKQFKVLRKIADSLLNEGQSRNLQESDTEPKRDLYFSDLFMLESEASFMEGVYSGLEFLDD